MSSFLCLREFIVYLEFKSSRNGETGENIILSEGGYQI